MNNLVKGMLGAAALTALAFAPKTSDGPKPPKYIDKANMDLSVKPGDNFYMYVNGGWIKNNPVPGSKTRWGSFDLLREESSKRMQTLLKDAVKKGATDARMQKIGDFYTSGMDSATVEALGYNLTSISYETGATGIPHSMCADKLLLIKNNDASAFAKAVINASLTVTTSKEFYDYFSWEGMPYT